MNYSCCLNRNRAEGQYSNVCSIFVREERKNLVRNVVLCELTVYLNFNCVVNNERKL